MQVSLLGTGAAEGIPALFCGCPLCVEARLLRGKDLRSRSTAVIDGVLKIDLPPDTLHHVLTQDLDLARIPNLLFTHGHDDHAALRELQYTGELFLRYPNSYHLDIHGPENVVQDVLSSVDVGSHPIAVHALTAWETVRIGPHAITPVPAMHDPERECFNYIIERDGRTLLYATDTGWYPEETWVRLEKWSLHAIVVECAKGLEEGGYMAHLNVNQVVAMKNRLQSSGALTPDARVITTHHSHNGLLLHREFEERLLPHGIVPGFDGMMFEV